MSKASGQTSSIWMKTVDMPSHSSLSENERADVCIVGAGIAGLSIASVVVHDAWQVGGGHDGPHDHSSLPRH